MLRHLWIAKLANRFRLRPRKRPVNPRPAVKLHLESLEERVVPATYDVSTAAQLQTAITAINSSTNTDTSDTIVLAPGTYKLSHQLTITNPNDQVTIQGGTSFSADTIIKAGGSQRAFLLENANIRLGEQGSVAFENLTIKNGFASDDGSGNPNTTAEGGAILDKGGNVTLSNVVLQNNSAQGNPGQNAAGGGVYVSGGSLNIVNSVIQKNQAVGGIGAGHSSNSGLPNKAGNASGGGLYVIGNDSFAITVAISDSTIANNTAQGGDGQVGLTAVADGQGGAAGDGIAGGLYVGAVGPVNLTVSGTTMSGNKALGGQGGQGAAGTSDGSQPGGTGGSGGEGEGGTIYLFGVANAILAQFTSSTLTDNSAKGGAGGAGGAGAASTTGSGGKGGAGGDANDGGLASVNARKVQINLSSLVDNIVTGGDGGDGGSNGGDGGHGGNASGGSGGGIDGGEVSITSSTLSGNSVRAGDGGAGGLGVPGQTGGTGGDAGDANGGAFSDQNIAFYLWSSTISDNSATGGAGGDGGNGLNSDNGGNGGQGGSVSGGGVSISGLAPFGFTSINSAVVYDAIINSTIANNTIKAGKGGVGGTGGEGDETSPAGDGGNGGNGGTAQGAGAYFNVPVQDIVLGSQGSPPLDGDNGNMGPPLQGQSQQSTYGVLLVNDTVAYNKATHGAGGAGGDAGAPSPSGGSLGSPGVSGGKTISQGGGIVNAANEGVSLINTLVALNTADEDADYDGEVDNTDHNLIGDDSGSFGFSTVNGDQLGTKAQPLDPGFDGQLTYNGGPMVGVPGDQTPLETIALAAGSPAVTGGDVSATVYTGSYDERGYGYARTVSNSEGVLTIDIGAYEEGPSSYDQGSHNGS